MIQALWADPGERTTTSTSMPCASLAKNSPKSHALSRSCCPARRAEFRNTFYAQYGDQLEAMGCPKDGTFPGAAEVNG